MRFATADMTTKRKSPPPADEPLVMHSAKLPASMVYRIGLLAATEGKTKQQLQHEAYTMLLQHYEKLGRLQPTAAELAVRILKGEGGSA